MKFIASAAFALEGVVADELRSLGFSDVICRNNRVIFTSDIEGAARACVWLRSADRVSLLLDSFKAESFDELFEGVAGMTGRCILRETAVSAWMQDASGAGLCHSAMCRASVKKPL